MAKTPENILRDELGRQADIYYDGFRIDRDAIMRLLVPRPGYLVSYIDRPVVTLGTSVNLKEQADFANIKQWYDLLLGHDIAGGITFGEPHLIWMHDGARFTNRSVAWVRENRPRAARPSPQADGIAVAIVHPDIKTILRHHSIDLPGTAVGPDGAPGLVGWIGGLGLRRFFVGYAGPSWGSALSGS